MPESAHDANVITDCYYVDGIPPLLRESSASAVMGFVLLCQWCVNPSPFRDLPISGFRLLGRGAFDSIASVLALLLRRVSKHRIAVTARVVSLSSHPFSSFHSDSITTSTVFSGLYHSAL